MKYKNLYKDIISVMTEAPIKHPNQKALDVAEPKGELTGADFKKLRTMKKTPAGKLHNCATHVEHSMYGEGQCIKEAHADPDEEGNISWYTVQFKDGIVRKIQTESMKIVASESHMHEEADQVEEAKMSHQASVTMKHIKNPTPGEKKAAQDIRPGVKGGYSDRIAMLHSAKARGALKEDEDDQSDSFDETTEYHDSFEVALKENYTFGDYLTAAKKLVDDDKAIHLANEAFRKQDTSIFVEQYSQSAIEDKVKAHMSAGHKVSMPKYSTRDGKPRAEYVVTDKESGVRRRYIHQGNVTKMENMGARGKKDEK